jgi:hypothetical protein
MGSNQSSQAKASDNFTANSAKKLSFTSLVREDGKHTAATKKIETDNHLKSTFDILTSAIQNDDTMSLSTTDTDNTSTEVDWEEEDDEAEEGKYICLIMSVFETLIQFLMFSNIFLPFFYNRMAGTPSDLRGRSCFEERCRLVPSSRGERRVLADCVRSFLLRSSFGAGSGNGRSGARPDPS